MGRGRVCYTWRCVYPLLFFLSRKITDAEERERSVDRFPLNFTRPFFPLSCHRRRFSPVFLSPFFLRIYLALKQKIGANSRAREINSPFVSWKTHPSSSPYFSSFFRYASFLHSARSCRQQSDQGWKLGPGR